MQQGEGRSPRCVYSVALEGGGPKRHVKAVYLPADIGLSVPGVFLREKLILFPQTAAPAMMLHTFLDWNYRPDLTPPRSLRHETTADAHRASRARQAESAPAEPPDKGGDGAVHPHTVYLDFARLLEGARPPGVTSLRSPSFPPGIG